MAEIGVLVDVGLVEVDQPMPITLGISQQILHLLDKGLPPLRIGSAEQLAGLLPGQFQSVQRTPDRLTAAAATESLYHPADQAVQGPARRRVSPG